MAELFFMNEFLEEFPEKYMEEFMKDFFVIITFMNLLWSSRGILEVLEGIFEETVGGIAEKIFGQISAELPGDICKRTLG